MTIENNNNKSPEIKAYDGKISEVHKPIETPRVKSSTELETAVVESRAAISADVKALGEKVTAANVKQEVKHVVKQAKEAAVDTVVETVADLKDATIEKVSAVSDVVVDKAVELKDATVEAAHRAAEAIEETVDDLSVQTRRIGKTAWRFTVANAVPLGLIGVGAGLLLSNQRQSSRSGVQPKPRLAVAVSEPQLRRASRVDDGDYASNVAYPAGGRAPTTGPRRRMVADIPRSESKLDEVKQSIAHGVSVTRDETAHALTTTKRTITDGAVRSREFVKENWQRTQRASSEFASAHPIALSFGAVLAGVGIGLLLPSTAREDALLQPSREKFRHAIGQAREVADDVTHLAHDTKSQVVAALDGSGA
jgi:hypothetical protein